MGIIIKRKLDKPFDWRNNIDYSGNYRELEYEDLVFTQKIGEGAFGQVFKGYWKRAEVAIKVLNANLDQEQVDEFTKREEEVKKVLEELAVERTTLQKENRKLYTEREFRIAEQEQLQAKCTSLENTTKTLQNELEEWKSKTDK